MGQRLACVLARGETEIVRRGDAFYWRVHHSQEVDRLLMEVTDSTELHLSVSSASPHSSA